MATEVDVDGFGIIEFPDSMSEADILGVLAKKFPKNAAPGYEQSSQTDFWKKQQSLFSQPRTDNTPQIPGNGPNEQSILADALGINKTDAARMEQQNAARNLDVQNAKQAVKQIADYESNDDELTKLRRNIPADDKGNVSILNMSIDDRRKLDTLVKKKAEYVGDGAGLQEFQKDLQSMQYEPLPQESFLNTADLAATPNKTLSPTASALKQIARDAVIREKTGKTKLSLKEDLLEAKLAFAKEFPDETWGPDRTASYMKLSNAYRNAYEVAKPGESNYVEFGSKFLERLKPDEQEAVIGAVSDLARHDKETGYAQGRIAQFFRNMNEGTGKTLESMARIPNPIISYSDKEVALGEKLRSSKMTENPAGAPESPWYDVREVPNRLAPMTLELGVAGLLGPKDPSRLGSIGATGAAFGPGMYFGGKDASRARGSSELVSDAEGLANATFGVLMFSSVFKRLIPGMGGEAAVKKTLAEIAKGTLKDTVHSSVDMGMVGAWNKITEKFFDWASGRVPQERRNELKDVLVAGKDSFLHALPTMGALRSLRVPGELGEVAGAKAEVSQRISQEKARQYALLYSKPLLKAAEWRKQNPGKTPSRVEAKEIGIPADKAASKENRKAFVDDAVTKVAETPAPEGQVGDGLIVALLEKLNRRLAERRAAGEDIDKPDELSNEQWKAYIDEAQTKQPQPLEGVPSDAKQVEKTGTPDGDGGTRPDIRQEGERPPEGSEGIQQGGRGNGEIEGQAVQQAKVQEDVSKYPDSNGPTVETTPKPVEPVAPEKSPIVEPEPIVPEKKAVLPRSKKDTAMPAQKALEDAKNSAKELGKKIIDPTRPSMGVDPSLLLDVGRVVYKFAKAGVKTFSELIDNISEHFGEHLDKYRPAFVEAWNKYARENGLDPAPTEESVDFKYGSPTVPPKSKEVVPTTTSPADTTGVKLAKAEEALSRVGRSPIQGSEAESVEQWHEEAKALVAADPERPEKLIRELLDKPRPLNPAEVMVMQDQARKVNDNVTKAVLSGNNETIKQTIAKQSEFYKATKAQGEQWGRGGVAQQQEIEADYSIAGMVRKITEAKNGVSLTPKELDTIVAGVKEIDRHNKELDEIYAKQAEERAKPILDQLEKEVEKETRLPKSVLSFVDRVVKWSDNRSESAKLRVKNYFSGTAPSSGLPVHVLADCAEIGLNKILHGAVEFAEWSKGMIGEFGERFGPHSEEVWAASNKLADDVANKAKLPKDKKADVTKAVTERANRVKKGETIDGITERIDSRYKKDGLITSEMANKLAKVIMQSGVRGRKNVLDMFHNIVNSIAPNITRTEAADILSKRGQITTPSKNAIDVELRDIKRQLQLEENIKEVRKGGKALRTGFQPGEQSDEVRKLEAELNKALSESEYKPSDDETQLRSPEQKAVRAIDNQITDLENDLKAGKIGQKPKSKKLTTTIIEARQSRLDALKARREEMRALDPAYQKSLQEREEAVYTRKLQERLADLKERVATGNFAKRKVVRNVNTRAQDELQFKIEHEKLQLRIMQKTHELAQRNGFEKFMDFNQDYTRAVVLAWPTIFEKLFVMAASRIVEMPLRELSGGLSSWRHPEIAANAPIHGGMSFKALLDGYIGLWTGVKSGMRMLARNEESQLSIRMGHGRVEPKSFVHSSLIYPGRLHAAVKEPIKQMSFDYAKSKYLRWAAHNNIDITNPFIMARIDAECFEYAQRQIFMNNNALSTKVHNFIRAQTDPKTGHATFYGKIGETAGKVVLPIIGVPTNIVAECFEHVTGLAEGNVRAHLAIKNGIENLKPEEADLIMRKLKNGNMGAAIGLFAILTGGEGIGAFYQRGKKYDENDLKPGEWEVWGLRFKIHSVPSMVYQFFATIAQTMNRPESPDNKEPQGVGGGTIAAILGLAEETPFLREATRIDLLQSPAGRERWLGEMAKSRIIPGFVQYAASKLDNETKRNPKTFGENIKMGVPILREDVAPKDTKKSLFKKY